MNRKRNVKARPRNRQRGPAGNAASQRDANAAPMSMQDNSDNSTARAEGQQSSSDSLAESQQRSANTTPRGRQRTLNSGPTTAGTAGTKTSGPLGTTMTAQGRVLGTTRSGVFPLPRRTRLVLTSLLVLVGIVAVWAGNLQGLWWITPLAGLVIGLVLRGTWLIVGAAFLVGLLGWGLELAWLAFSLPIGRAASVVAGIMGFGTGQGGVVIVLTLLLGVLLCLGGAWVGAALRRLLPPPRTA